MHTSTGSFPLEQILAARSAFLLPRSGSRSASLSFNPSPTGVPLFQRVPPSFYDPSTYRGDFFHRGTRFKLFLEASFLRVEFKIDFRSLLEYFDRFAVIVLSLSTDY